ncbi:RDD family protein [Evansella sp. AB-P1]|uniref:RDD family protein n=1 Tax=Evansella sp. AB-P1 TaxID=3037653 RepID=UPI00241DF660|nr:RDD family protein [Evansella sp. AB-P1]MDG5788033.1 RDD family protein [Evansella sp. AB-P1]
MDIFKDSPAHFMTRLAAITIDYGIFFVLLFIFSPILPTPLAIILFFTLSCMYFIVLPLAWDGYTVGKRVAGIRVAHLDGRELTIKELFLRQVIGGIIYIGTAGILTLVSGYMVLKRDDKRSIHDKISSTFVTNNSPEEDGLK